MDGSREPFNPICTYVLVHASTSCDGKYETQACAILEEMEEKLRSKETRVEEVRQQLARYWQEFVDIFRNPPQGVEIKTVEVAWLSPEEWTQEFLVDVPNVDCPEVATKYKVSYVRARTGPIAQAIMVENTGVEVTDSGGGYVKGWGEAVLPDGSLSGHSGRQQELSKLETTAIRCGEILKVLKRRDEETS